MERAPMEKSYTIPGYEDVQSGRVKWPMSVLRLRCSDRQRIAELAERILTAWRGYSDPEAYIFAETEGEPHNTVTPIARRRGDDYEMDIVLRNNITTPEHPLGLFHPHAELHHIKKENIGLIEVMGLAVLPSRLKHELEKLAEHIYEGKDHRSDSELCAHADWADTFAPELEGKTLEQIEERIRLETGKVFAQVLEHAGVYKRDEQGMAAFDRFVESL
ncbi:MAG: galactose-1-phosphate uridylyltransferase, partial [Oscillospiraceae bacterium]|nr:galactose-1-phosphate uridylyltransferase [Oscillospiraceae bacterium]